MKKRGRGTYDSDKPPIVTFVHRKSKFTVFTMAKNLSKKLIATLIDKLVDEKAILHTDEYTIYLDIAKHKKISKHLTVKHSKKQYANGLCLFCS